MESWQRLSKAWSWRYEPCVEARETKIDWTLVIRITLIHAFHFPLHLLVRLRLRLAVVDLVDAERVSLLPLI